MENKLSLAEAYYAVANDLHHQGRNYLEMAEKCGRIADALCEANMREKAKQPEPCTRSHPHENMSLDCARLTEIARSLGSATESK